MRPEPSATGGFAHPSSADFGSDATLDLIMPRPPAPRRRWRSPRSAASRRWSRTGPRASARPPALRTPWYRIRLTRGGGVNAARRSRSSTGSSAADLRVDRIGR